MKTIIFNRPAGSYTANEVKDADTLYKAGEISESREFADGVRVIVSGYERAKYGKECGIINGYDPETGKYWVIFRSGHGDGDSWHAANELEHLPEWVTEGAQVYNLKGWHTGDPFTISNASAEVVTMTTADGFKFECDPVELVNEYAPRYTDGEKSGFDLYKQAERLINHIASDYWATTDKEERARISKRMNRIADIQHRYNRNIAKHFHGDTNYLSNENYVKPVNRTIYMGI